MRRKILAIQIGASALLGVLSTLSLPEISAGSAILLAYGLPKLLKSEKKGGDFFTILFVWLIAYTFAFNLGVKF